MQKRLVNSTVVLLVLALCSALALAGCGGTTSNADISKKVDEQVAAANAALEDAKAKGVQISEADQKLVTTAQNEAKSAPVQALIDATVAKSRIENDVSDAFDVANQTFSTALGAAQGAIKAAPQGTDLAKANQSIANAEARKASAKTVTDYYNPTDGPIYWANLAAEQATEAANARAVALGQQQGITQEAKALQGHISQIIGSVNSYLTSKKYDPATFTVGITKANSDASVITAVAVPQQQIPGQPAYLTFVFQYKNGAYVISSGPQ